MDSLDIMDKFYEKKYQDMETRLYRLYDEIEGVENSIEEVKNRLLNIQQQKISEENVYQFLLYFDKLYGRMYRFFWLCRYRKRWIRVQPIAMKRWLHMRQIPAISQIGRASCRERV